MPSWFNFKTISKAQLWASVHALWLLMRHPQAPLAPKLVAALVACYALSPIDLIPDFIPVLGMLDDIVLIPLGIALAIKLTPAPLWQALLAQAQANPVRLGTMRWGVALVIVVWLLALGLCAWWVWM